MTETATRWARLVDRLDRVDAISRAHTNADPAATARADQGVAGTREVLGLYGVDCTDRVELLAAAAGAHLVLLTAVGMAERSDIPADAVASVDVAANTILAAVARLVPQAPAARTWTVEHAARPWTLNGERKLSKYQRADLVRSWRHAFAYLIKQAKVPHLDRITVTATPILADRVAQDVAGCFPAAKAAIDGIKDAGVITDDGPDVVTFLGFNAPVLGAGRDALQLTIQEAPPWTP